MGRHLTTLIRLTATLAMGAGLVSSCGHAATPSAPPKQPERWPPTLSDLHFVWTAEPGIDLLSQPVVALRAYTESKALVASGGSLDYLYPGFNRAVEPNAPPNMGNPYSTLSRYPEPGGDGKRLAGTALNHVLRIAETGRDVTVILCNWTYGAAWQQRDGMYRIQTPNAGATAALVVERISLLAPADRNLDVLAPQKGPSPYSLIDVFGGWKIVGSLWAFNTKGFTQEWKEWPEFPQDQAACADRAPVSVERREYLTSAERPRSDFPTLPSYPGWPVETK